VFRSASKDAAHDSCVEAAKLLRSEAQKISRARQTTERNITAPVEILGPAECPLSKIAANYRMQILLKSSRVKTLQDITRDVMQNIKIPAGVHIELDVDPVNLL
jgi:primosomal protein N' (replication factor Y)